MMDARVIGLAGIGFAAAPSIRLAGQIDGPWRSRRIAIPLKNISHMASTAAFQTSP
jgi:hypothetical protein